MEWCREDIVKYTGGSTLIVKHILDLIPHKLSGRNKRFMAKSIEGKAQLPQRLVTRPPLAARASKARLRPRR